MTTILVKQNDASWYSPLRIEEHRYYAEMGLDGIFLDQDENEGQYRLMLEHARSKLWRIPIKVSDDAVVIFDTVKYILK